MLLILGTSLRVHGLKTVVREFAKAVHSKGGKVVFVNFTKPPDSVWSDVIDFWVQSDCDAWVSDIKTRKPALWLPPGTVVDEEQKPAKGKRNSNGASTALKRTSTGLSQGSDKESTKTAKAKHKSNCSSIKLRQQESTQISKSSSEDLSPSALYISEDTTAEPEAIVEPATANDSPQADQQGCLPDFALAQLNDGIASPDVAGIVVCQQQENASDLTGVEEKTRKSLPRAPGARSAVPKRETILNPNAKRPQSIRDEAFNGAHLSWKVLENLKRLTGQGKPTFLYSRSPEPAPKAARPKRPRKSAPAALASVSEHFPHPSPPAFSTPLQPHDGKASDLLPSTPHKRSTLPYDPVYQSSPAMVSQSYTPLVPESPPHTMFLSLQQPVHYPLSTVVSTFAPVPHHLKAPTGFSVKGTIARSTAMKGEATQQTDRPATSGNPVISPTSIGAAIKTNPRKRKRKTIDGAEVVLPSKGTRTANARHSLPMLSSGPVSSLPKTPRFVLPDPRKSGSAVTARVLTQTQEDENVKLAPFGYDVSPIALGTLEPAPIFRHVYPQLPASTGHHKLGSFYTHVPQSRLTTPFNNLSLDGDNRFGLRNPLVALPYGTSPLVDRHNTPVTPSEQLQSEEEAALSLSLLHNAPQPAEKERYLAGKTEDLRKMRANRDDRRVGTHWVEEDMSRYYGAWIGIR